MPIGMFMPIKVFIYSLLVFKFFPVFWILYKLVFSTTKSIKESGKNDKKYCIGVQSVPGGLLKVPLNVILADSSIFFSSIERQVFALIMLPSVHGWFVLKLF